MPLVGQRFAGEIFPYYSFAGRIIAISLGEEPVSNKAYETSVLTKIDKTFLSNKLYHFFHRSEENDNPCAQLIFLPNLTLIWKS